MSTDQGRSPLLGGGSLFGNPRSLMAAGLPWPSGDADGLESAARQLNRSAGSLSRSEAELERAGAVKGDWQGSASGAFDQSLAGERQLMARGSVQLGTGAQAVRRLAGTVERAQERVGRLARRLRDLEDDAREKRKGATAAEEAATETRQSASLNPNNPAAGMAASKAADASTIATSRANAAESRARTYRTKAERLAREACNEVREQDATTASVLAGVAGQAPLGGARGGGPPGPAPTSPLATVVVGRIPLDWAFDGQEGNFLGDPRRYNRDARNLDEDALRRGNLDQAVVPFSYRMTPNGLQVEFWPFYPYNDYPTPPLLYGISPAVGVVANSKSDHKGDYERVGLQFDKLGRPAYVAPESHGKLEGALPWGKLDRVNGRARLYPARGGHGTYLQSGDQPRGGIFPDDQADGMGPVFPNGRVVDLRATPGAGSKRLGEVPDPVSQMNKRPLPDLSRTPPPRRPVPGSDGQTDGPAG